MMVVVAANEMENFHMRGRSFLRTHPWISIQRRPEELNVTTQRASPSPIVSLSILIPACIQVGHILSFRSFILTVLEFE